MAITSNVSGSYNATTDQLNITVTTVAGDLELGSEFTPSMSGRHYGTSGTLGGPFTMTMSLANVTVQSDGTIPTGGGGAFNVKHVGSASGSLKDDYAFTNGNVPLPNGHDLLLGKALEVMLDPPPIGLDKLDILVELTGGALQAINPALGTNFAPRNLAILRISGIPLPSNWSANFSLNGARIDILGIPEPSTMALVLVGALFGARGASRRCFSTRSAG